MGDSDTMFSVSTVSVFIYFLLWSLYKTGTFSMKSKSELVWSRKKNMPLQGRCILPTREGQCTCNSAFFRITSC